MVGATEAPFKQTAGRVFDTPPVPGYRQKTLARRGTILLALLLGCGPVTATSVIDDAELALRRARASESDQRAQYETTLAELYLAKARELQGKAQYGDARALASDALRFANAAGRKAGEPRSGAAALGSAAVQKP